MNSRDSATATGFRRPNGGANENFLHDGAEMGALIRSFDWSQTAIGALPAWPQSLRMMVSFLLANRFPMLLWWGPDYICIYNDAYRPVLGKKHPWALGRPVSECWSEIWPILKPLIDTPFHGGPATWSEDLELELRRTSFTEETHFTIAYSPVPDETAVGGIGGVLATVHEITGKVISERRVVVLRDLSTRAAEAKTAGEACATAAETLAAHAKDVPFALLYLTEPDGKRARLAASSGVDGASADFYPLTIDLDGPDTGSAVWPLAAVLASEHMEVVENLAARFKTVPPGPWSDPPQCAVVLPIASNIAHQLAGFLVAGVSARVTLDEAYKNFFEVAVGPIATAIANARASEQERRRAEALAEIDRAKTAFFSNVSHEFRTPLTLMLGPLEDALANTELPAAERERLDVAHRNSLRLLKLVNSLLDFSRIEAGRAQSAYEPVDLAAFTTELASNFRSACERAHLTLVVDCPPLPEPVYVDRDMWEKIVLNLLSNAFKFTFEGGITVRLRAVDGRAELSVHDTGVGVPAHEVPRLFERFHRIQGQKSRTYEGSGIGLALVQELVKLHGGTIHAESTAGQGATFTLSIPFGAAHLPQNRIGSQRSPTANAVRSETYVQEALRWLPDEAAPDAEMRDEIAEAGDLPPLAEGAYVLVADDNADMRAYVQRLLGPKCNVKTVADGQAALEALRERRPDLVLADVMMPRLDGFALLRAIRADASIRDLPVIMLSARAGEESRVEGIEAGADDYVVKPFSARELIARISAHLGLSRLRREATEELRQSEARLASDLAGMRRLYDLYAKLAAETDLKAALDEIIAAACEFTGTDRGCVQLVSNDGERLQMFAWRGYADDGPFITHFRYEGLKQGCDVARAEARRMLVEDWTIFQGLGPDVDAVIRAEGIAASQSTPIVTRKGETVGVLSTQFPRPHRSSDDELRLIDLLAWIAADFVERHRADAALRENAARQAFLLELSDRTNPLGDTGEIIGLTTRLVGVRLGVERCGFGEIDTTDEFVVIEHDWTSGVLPGLAGCIRLNEYGRAAIEEYRAGRTLVLGSVLEDARTQGTEEAYARIAVRAGIGVPLIRAGRLAAVLYVHSLEARDWTPAEIELVEAVAGRLWVVIERARAEAALRTSLAEKEALLKEVHHRVKNNLQVITSLINLQAAQIDDEHELALFEETRNRVQSIAYIHELLYRSTSFAAIDLVGYARQLVPDLVRFYDMEDRLDARVSGEGFTLELERAVPFGLLLNELISNACKHAFPGQRRGQLSLSFIQEDRHTVLKIADNGVGLPEGFNYQRAPSLGLQLVHNLARQMRAAIDIQSEAGTQITVRVPEQRETTE